MGKHSVLHWLTTQALRGVGGVSGKLSPRYRQRLGRFIGSALRWVSSARYAITLDNIANAFPAMPQQERQGIATGAYANLGITLVELLSIPSLSDSDVRSMIAYGNLHLIEEAYAEGKGLILLSAHYGNWELLAYALPLYTSVPVSVIVQPQRNTSADTLLNSYRSRTGNRLIARHKAAREVIQLLSVGNAVALLADQSATADKDIFVQFFGRLAATYEAPAALSLKFDAPIVMGFAERREDGSYFVDLQRIPHEDLVYNREGIAKLTQRHVAALEEAVRKKPELWVWQHRRWKHSPVQEQ